MMTPFWNNFKMLLWLTFLTGGIYPLLITSIAQLTIKDQANGLLIWKEKQLIGAPLIGQKFENPKYFWGRPSATNYSLLPSGGSNLGPTSKQLKKIVEERRDKLVKGHGRSIIPAELLFASGSGVDPHITPETAYWQIDRIVKARQLDPIAGRIQLQKIIDSLVIPRFLGCIGTPCVNVLLLNLALDKETKTEGPSLQS